MIGIPVKNAYIDYDYNELDGFKITVEVGSGYTHSANTIKNLIEKNVPLEFTLKKSTEEKTQKQLGLAWSAMSEIAGALEIPVKEVYKRAVMEYGKSEFAMVPADKADEIAELHESIGDGYFAEIVGIAKQDPKCKVVKLGWGFSHYTKEEMSRFLDGIADFHTEVIGP